MITISEGSDIEQLNELEKNKFKVHKDLYLSPKGPSLVQFNRRGIITRRGIQVSFLDQRLIACIVWVANLATRSVEP